VIPTLLISAVGVIDDAAQTIDMSLKQPGDLLYQIGITRNELAGSHYAEIIGMTEPFPATEVPHVNLTTAPITMKTLGSAIRKGLVQACHDLSEGGLAIAAAEMSLAGLLGMTIDVQQIPHEIMTLTEDMKSSNDFNTILLFSESASRFLVEVSPEHQDTFEAHMRANGVLDIACIGVVNESQRLLVQNADRMLIDLSVAELQNAWKGEQA
jgi:phosphoribosylformylglycinamidine synthase subunit PurSL